MSNLPTLPPIAGLAALLEACQRSQRKTYDAKGNDDGTGPCWEAEAAADLLNALATEDPVAAFSCKLRRMVRERGGRA
jgi:hypothetical protein